MAAAFARTALRSLGIGILAAWLAWPSAEAHAATPPWVTALSPEREQQLLDEERERLGEAEAKLLPLAIEQGMLLATAMCESSGTIRSHNYVDKQWVGDVENSATVWLRNLSDHVVWLVDVGIVPQLDGLPTRDELGEWHANVPFIPAHSEALILMPCNTLTATGGGSLDQLVSDGTPGPMNEALARKLAATPSMFRQIDTRISTLYQAPPTSLSLARYALAFVDERETARLLVEAIARHDELETLDSLAPALGHASLDAAQGIVDALIDAPTEQLVALLLATLAQRGGTNDDALLRLVTHVCELGSPEDVEGIVGREFESKHDDAFVAAVLRACPLEPAATVILLERLAETKGRRGRPPPGLVRFIDLAQTPNFEIGLSLMLGADRALFEQAQDPDQTPDASQADQAPDAAPPVPEIIDGGERAMVLWHAMATLPSPERRELLERLIRAQDVSEVLTMLIRWQMSADRMALFKRVAKRIEELPAAERGEALAPVFAAAIDSPYLEHELMLSLFDLVELDPERLRPRAIEALSKNQDMFTSEALAGLPYSLEQLLEKLEGPLADCAAPERLLDCYAVFEADPTLWAAAESGFTPKFEALLTASMTRADPTDGQRAALQKYMQLGVDIDSIAQATCTRALELATFDGDTSEHVAFLDEFAPEHPCTQELHDKLGAELRMMMMLGGGVAGVLALVGLGVLISRRRQQQLLEDA